jgi:hypothetical protein
MLKMIWRKRMLKAGEKQLGTEAQMAKVFIIAYRRAYNITPWKHVLRQFNAVRTFIQFSKHILLLPFHLHLSLPSETFLWDLYELPARLILLDLIILTILLRIQIAKLKGAVLLIVTTALYL